MDREKRELDKHKAKAQGAAAAKKPRARQTPEVIPYQKQLIFCGVSLIVALFVAPSFTVMTPEYQVGDIADHNVKTHTALLIEDKEGTLQKRREAAEQAPVVYDLDQRVALDTVQKLRTAFGAMRLSSTEKPDAVPSRRAETQEGAPKASEEDVSEASLKGPPLVGMKTEFSSLLGVDMPQAVFETLVEENFPKAIESETVRLLEAAFGRGIVANKDLLMQAAGKSLVLRQVRSQKEKIALPPHNFPDLEEARKLVRVRASALKMEPRLIAVVSRMASDLLQPNLTFNREETEYRKERAAQSVKPVYIHLKKNEMLVREGERIDAEDVLKLRALRQRGSERHQWVVFATIFVFCAFCIWVLVRESRKHIPTLQMDARDFLFLAILLVFLLLLGRFTTWLTDNLGETSVYLTSKALIYAIPLTAGAMMASIFFGATVSLLFSLLVTLLAGMLFGRDFELFLFFLIGSFVAAHTVTPCKNRMTPLRSGFMVGATNVVLIVMIALLQEEISPIGILINGLFGFCGGIFAGVLVTGLTPLAEMVFGYTTDIKLLELATMDQPLLQELMVQAPGTYHHSIILGNMVETAAKSIGANPLLAKVAAYYHDIGKIKKPLYFIENQFNCGNRHEKLAPSMSSLILISHVKEGVELAKKYRLGKPIIEIISQHHGTSLITFFYKKALEAREKAQTTKGAELPRIDIDDYRYPGPKPQTKEAGLVMLGDVVEAACRSLSEPTPARIQGMVNRLISNVFTDGQLDECELTLKDIHLIAKHFNQILATVHHKRIQYPSVPTGNGRTKGKGNEPDSHHREPKPDGHSGEKDREVGKGDLKRLGLH